MPCPSPSDALVAGIARLSGIDAAPLATSDAAGAGSGVIAALAAASLVALAGVAW